ncbi:MAG TPA: putative porin [Candidatus Acidoferrum sp.]|nr:putative porin [Candidatus Acidoferrum sp.]
MKRLKKQNVTAKFTLFAGATTLLAFTPTGQAQTSVDALLNKLEQKGILTVDEAKELRAENQQDSAADINKAINAKFPMPDWVVSYKLYGSFRGRFDDELTDNPGVPDPSDPTKGLSGQSRVRWRYRLLAGLEVNMKNDLQVGFRIGSGDSGSPLSSNQTMQDNASNKSIWIDTAYGRWTAINNQVCSLAATIGKMDQPFQVSPMVFDADYMPEGAALQAKYNITDAHSIAINGGAFVLDEVKGSARDPYITGAQAIWNANWTSRIATSLGFAAFDIVNPGALGLSGFPANSANYNPGGVPNSNQGNTYNSSTGNLVYNYNPIIASASTTYTLDTFPLYRGKFPIKFSGEYMYNGGADPAKGDANNVGWWAGVQLGKSGKQGMWDIFYRYQYLEADAWYDNLVDDDNVAFYSNTTLTQPLNGWAGGTNIKGHLVKCNYSLTDALTFSFTAYVNELINPNQNVGSVGQPKNNALHVMADLMWKF